MELGQKSLYLYILTYQCWIVGRVGSGGFGFSPYRGMKVIILHLLVLQFSVFDFWHIPQHDLSAILTLRSVPFKIYSWLPTNAMVSSWQHVRNQCDAVLSVSHLAGYKEKSHVARCSRDEKTQVHKRSWRFKHQHPEVQRTSWQKRCSIASTAKIKKMEKKKLFACSAGRTFPSLQIEADRNLCTLQSHLTWEWMLIVSIPFADKIHIWVGFLTSGKRSLIVICQYSDILLVRSPLLISAGTLSGWGE